MVCNVVTYQARSAIRDLGKVLELPETSLEQLLGKLDTHSPHEAAAQLEGVARHLVTLLRQIDGRPRHLSIHSGGMLITRRRWPGSCRWSRPLCPGVLSASGIRTAWKMQG